MLCKFLSTSQLFALVASCPINNLINILLLLLESAPKRKISSLFNNADSLVLRISNLDFAMCPGDSSTINIAIHIAPRYPRPNLLRQVLKPPPNPSAPRQAITHHHVQSCSLPPRLSPGTILYRCPIFV